MPKKAPPISPGRPKVDKDLQEARKITKTEFLNIMTEYLSMRTDTLERIVDDKSKPVLHVLIGKIALTAIEFGDPKRLEFFMDRMIGPVPKEQPAVNLSINIQNLPPERVIQLGKDAIKYLEESE